MQSSHVRCTATPCEQLDPNGTDFSLNDPGHFKNLQNPGILVKSVVTRKI
jgi:hypothetical protein